MSSNESTSARLRELADIEVAKIGPNPNNPRIHFTPEEMDRLTESIARRGVLVPVVVYGEDDSYVLIDGERRWRCAQELGLETIPAVITDPPNEEENLVQMFNIHMVRESWKDIPTANALAAVVKETGIEDNRELSELTGLSLERIKRLRHALELPEEYQNYINEGRIPLNFFYELKRSVIDPLAKRRPSLWQEFGEGEVLDAFVAKRLRGVVTDTVSLRNVLPIITYAEREVDEPDDESPLDDTLRGLIREEAITIDEAYEDTVQVVFEADKLERRSRNMVKSFERLLSKARSSEELEYVKRVGGDLAEKITALIR